VLQEHSIRPIEEIDKFQLKTVFFADALVERIYSNNPQTKIMFFMT
jgi:hypothetical protein